MDVILSGIQVLHEWDSEKRKKASSARPLWFQYLPLRALNGYSFRTRIMDAPHP
jgi:hypothetical protein